MTESEQRLLKQLLRNSRASMSSLSEEMNKGRNWTARTIRRMVKSGVIRAYVAVLDPAQVYAERNTILLIKTNPRELGVSEDLLDMPELESLDGISGDHSLSALFRFRSPGAFERFLDDIDKTIAKSGAQTYELVQVLTTYKSRGFAIEKAGPSEQPLSRNDRILLNVLRRCRPSSDRPLPLSQDEIGKAMLPELTQPAVSKAMRRLENRGVVVGYSVDISFKHVGLPIKFFLQIRPRPGTVAESAHRIGKMEEVWDLHRVSQDYSLYATVRTSSVDDYNSFLRRLYKDKDIQDTQSQISLEEWFIPVQ